MSESAAQLLAIQRGDIDVAFNLIPEQIATLKDDPNITVEGMTSLDFIYMAVVGAPTTRRCRTSWRGRPSAMPSTTTASSRT